MRLKDQDDVNLSVGRDEVDLSKGDEKTIEKRVRQPVRWIKGFSKV